MISKASTISLKFNGGLNTLHGPLNIEDTQSPNCKNVHTNLIGTLQRRKGFSVLGTATSGSSGYGIFDYWSDETTHYLMCYIDTYLYKIDVSSNDFDGTLDPITLGTAMTADNMEFEQFNDGGTNYLVMSTHSRNTLQKYDGTTCTDLSSDTDMPASKYIKQWKGYLFCANIAGYESRVYYNDVSGSIIDDGDWDATDYQDIRTNDGDFITGLAVLKGRLYTFKRYSIHRWTYLGGTPLFSLKAAISGVGTKASNTIKNINHPKYGEVLAFLGTDGRFYVFDGSQVFPISNIIEADNDTSEFNLTKISMNYLDGACAVDYKFRHWYVCWLPTTSYNNWCLVWDYYTDAWFPFNNMDARACGVGESNGVQRAYFIESSGAVNKFDDGNDDAGSAVNSLYDSKKFNYGDQAILKSQRYIDIQLKNNPTTELNFYHRSDWEYTWGTAEALDCNGGGFILGTSILGTGVLGGPSAKTNTINLNALGQCEQFRWASNDTKPPWHIYNADVVAVGRGYGRLKGRDVEA